MSSVVLFDPARFAGSWRVAESAVPGCAGARQDWRWDGHGRWDVAGTDCTGGAPGRMSGKIALTGPSARFTPENGAYGGARIWLLWADQDYRIAVLGTPSGSFATVLVRDYPARGDLLTAANRVLDFNGYDVRRIGR